MRTELSPPCYRSEWILCRPQGHQCPKTVTCAQTDTKRSPCAETEKEKGRETERERETERDRQVDRETEKRGERKRNG